ncbi:MAG: tetratricopeptide repeat protein [Chloroflexota bacterium]|nr:tetratricopeptide repeat protein [Chloroflexota bacterium]
MQVGALPTPTLAPPTATPIPTPTPDIIAQSSQGAGERPSEWDDGDVTLITMASPYLVFADGGRAIELFEDGFSAREYVLIERGFRLRVQWNGLWLANAHGVANLTMAVNVQPPWASEYESWDWVSTDDVEGWGSSYQLQLLDSTLWFSEPGAYRVSAEVDVTVRDDDGEDTRSANFETELMALVPPESIDAAEDVTLIQPRLGDLEYQGVFIDWRAWGLGPCAVRVDDSALTRKLDEACVAADSGDWQGGTLALQAALDIVDDDAELAALLRGHIGVLASVAGAWNVAARNYREALDLWIEQGRAYETALTLHNLGIALVELQRWDEGVDLLEQSWRLRDKLGDYVGTALTYGQFSMYWDSAESQTDASNTMREYGMPQGDILASLIDD